MKKEQKVISLELAQKISKIAKEKGIKLAESEWWWKLQGTKWELVDRFYMWELVDRFYMFDKNYYGDKRFYPAYDTSELGEMLPAHKILKTDSSNRWGQFAKLDAPHFTDQEDKEVEIRGKMLYCLIANNLYGK